jgi:glycosyltransferase involved in cell wall biosynthesis
VTAARSRPLRILMATPLFVPHRGGVETHTAEVSSRLAAMGFEITVLTTDPGGTLPRHEDMNGVVVERVGAWPPRGDLYWSPAVARAVARADVDLLHCQGYHTFVPPLAMLAARRRRLPYVLTFHSGGHSSSLRRAIRPAQVRLLRPLLRGARRLIAVSDFEADLFRRSLGVAAQRVTVIPSGVDAPTQASGEPVARDPHLLVSVGRLERYKGHDRVIRAFAHVRAGEPRARLRILGSGPDEERLRGLAGASPAADAIAFDSVPREEVSRTLREAGVVALLSEYESQGLGAHEAIALGCRLVVSDSSALAELGRFSQVRLVPPSLEDERLAGVLLEQLRAGPAADGAVGLPSWDECAQRLAALYREVAGTSA